MLVPPVPQRCVADRARRTAPREGTRLRAGVPARGREQPPGGPLRRARFQNRPQLSIALAVPWELARAGKIPRPACPGDRQVQAGPPGQRGAQLNPGQPPQNLPWHGRIGWVVPLPSLTRVTRVISPSVRVKRTFLAERTVVLAGAQSVLMAGYARIYGAAILTTTFAVGVPLADVSAAHSDQAELDAAVEAIGAALARARRLVILPAFTLARYGLAAQAEALAAATGIPFAATAMDKGILPESQPYACPHGRRRSRNAVGSVVLTSVL
jgi:hypothetical protein